jgi:hypothetical protein
MHGLYAQLRLLKSLSSGSKVTRRALSGNIDKQIFHVEIDENRLI